MRAYLRLENGHIQTDRILLKEIEQDGVTAVYIDAVSNDTIDADFGAGIEIELDEVSQWMANWRHCEFWCMPSFGTDLSDIPDETQGLLCRKENGAYRAIIPVVSEKYKCVLCGGNNKVIAKLFSWYDKLISVKGLAFITAEGYNPYEVIQNCVKTAVKLLNNGCRVREQRRYPEIFEYLGWCSWDAFEIRVSEENLLAKCKEFREKNIPVRWAIIDDMWAEVRDFYDREYNTREEMFDIMHSSKLYSMKADPKRFPNGLKQCIDKMKETGIKVGMWYPTTGYWMGIDPDSEISKDCKDYLIQTFDGKIVPDYRQDKAYMYYCAFNDYLSKCGAEFVKIDNQSMTRRYYKNLAEVGTVARQFHNGIEASVGQYFDNTMINCMGMASEDMWNRTVSPVSRCSDDFLPENREWFTKHILQCSFNSLIQGQLYYCDWDMWWTDDAQAIKNSILRAISGGPIYVSDTYERSRRDVLMPLCLENGKILRCDRPAMPTEDCLTTDPTNTDMIFKLQNTCKGSGVVAVFNLKADNSKAAGTVSPGDVEGLIGEEFAVYEHFSKDFCILKADESINVILNNADEYKLYIITPLENGFGAIGRTDKFISPATVKSITDRKVELVENGEYAYVEDYKLIFG